jgi:Protein of unknown function (DUF3175)
MLTFYVNRAGKNLSAGRRRVLERAKELLHERIEKSKSTRAHRSTTERAGTTRARRSRNHR